MGRGVGISKLGKRESEKWEREWESGRVGEGRVRQCVIVELISLTAPFLPKRYGGTYCHVS